MKNNGFVFEPAKSVDYFIACVNDEVKHKAFEIAQTLRDNGFSVELDHQNKSLKSQFKLADKFYSKFTIVIGPDEIKNGELSIRDMQNHSQQNIKISELLAFANGKN